MRVLQNDCDKAVVGVAFDAAGRTLFAGGYGGFQAWPLRGKGASKAAEHPGGKTLYGFEPDAAGKHLFVSNSNSGFRAYHLPTGRVGRFPDGTDDHHVVSLTARPGGTHVAVSRGGGGYNRAECWDVTADGRFAPVWRLADGAVTTDFDYVYIGRYRHFTDAVRYAPDGRALAVVVNRHANPNGPHALSLHAADTGVLLGELGTLPVAVGFDMRFTPDGSRLIGWESSWIEVWDVAAGKRVGRVTPPGRAFFNAVAVHPSGGSFVTVANDGRVRTWDLSTLTETAATDLGVGKLHAVAFHPKGRTGAAGADGGKVVLWDADD
jgi:WD40 repeat protein